MANKRYPSRFAERKGPSKVVTLNTVEPKTRSSTAEEKWRGEERRDEEGGRRKEVEQFHKDE